MKSFWSELPSSLLFHLSTHHPTSQTHSFWFHPLRFIYCIFSPPLLCTSASWKVPSSALTQMASKQMLLSLSLSSPCFFSFFSLSFWSCLTLSLLLVSYSLSSLSLSLSPFDHFWSLAPLPLPYSYTALSVTHALLPALPVHHLHHRGSSVCLRFARWTHSSQSPFPPRRVPRWLHSPFLGWASGGRPWWQLLLGSCWSWSWWSSSLCWSAPLARVVMTVQATTRCWAHAAWFVTPSPAQAQRAQVCMQEQTQRPQACRWTATPAWVITASAHHCLPTVPMAHKANQDARGSLDPQDLLESQAHQDPKDHREMVWTLYGREFWVWAVKGQ